MRLIACALLALLILIPAGSSEAAPMTVKSTIRLSHCQTSFNQNMLNQAANIQLAASRIKNITIMPGHNFSFNLAVGPYTRANGFLPGRGFNENRIVTITGGGVCQVASTLYNAVMLAGLEIIERHPHSLTVSYLPPGGDATVNDNSLDFKFRNNTSRPVQIKSEAWNNNLSISIWGYQLPPEIHVYHKILEVYRHGTIFVSNSSINGKNAKVIFPGQDGMKVQTWMTITSNSSIITKPISIDTYNPSPKIIQTDNQDKNNYNQ